jgi:hypothetical protein
MNANTVYDVFLALPEVEKQRHFELVNKYFVKEETKPSLQFKKKNSRSTYTKQDAMEYLLKTVFKSKKSTIG